MGIVGIGYHWNARETDQRLRTTEADLAAFIGMSWMNELHFTNAEYQRSESVIEGRVVPGAMELCIAEGLRTPTMQHTGPARTFNQVVNHRGDAAFT